MREGSYDDLTKEKIYQNKAKLVLQGRLTPSFAIYKSGNEYSLEIYPETLPDGKERYVLRRIRNCESSRPKKFPTVSEKHSKAYPRLDDFKPNIDLNDRIVKGFQHIINIVIDDKAPKADKITKIKQLLHHANHDQYYQIVGSYIIENHLQEDVEKVFDFVLKNREDILNSKYFSQEDYQSVLGIMHTISVLVDNPEEK